ncbi:MAG: nucleotidyl transferase AbiEii/AbiGii toxin family protein [Thermoleophilaceae bacterium]
MRYRDARAFRMALEQRLNTGAGGDGARLARDRKRVVFDRLLARLTATAPDRWLLKGGFALELRLAERARATKDVDLDWLAAEEELLDALLDAAAHDVDDFFHFLVERTGTPEDRLGGSHRFRVAASLAGRPFETFLLDVGFRREGTAQVEQLTTPGLLAFAGIAPVKVAAIPLRLEVARLDYELGDAGGGDRHAAPLLGQ